MKSIKTALRALSVGVAAAFISAGAFAQGAPVVLKFHTFMAPQSNVWQDMHMAWMNKVEKEANGRIKFERYPAMQAGGTPAQLFDQAKDGVVDIVWTLPGNTPGRFLRTEAFELPFMMTNAEATSRAFWEYIQTTGKDEYKDVQVLALHVHGPGVLHMRDKHVKNIADLKGMKLRAPTRPVTKLLTSLGATAVGMPLPQIPDALSKGVVDGAVIPWEVVPSVKVNELAKFHSEFDPKNRAIYTTTFVMAMNKAKYDALPADVKRVIDANSGIETSGWLGKTQEGNDGKGRATVANQASIHRFTPADYDAFRKAADLVDDDWIKEVSGKGLNGKQLYDLANSLIQKHTK